MSTAILHLTLRRLGRDGEAAAVLGPITSWMELDRARKIFERILETPSWPAFGYIAAEAELAAL